MSSINRLQKFLKLENERKIVPEIRNNGFDEEKSQYEVELLSRKICWKKKELGVKGNHIIDASASLLSVENEIEDEEENPDKLFALKNIDLKIKKGELVSILGDNGAGKTSLLLALLGELEPSDTGPNPSSLKGKVSFMSQNPWIMTATVLENITLGNDVDPVKLKAALKLACFKREVMDMESGVNSICSDKGANLSGGQRARLNLTRVFY